MQICTLNEETNIADCLAAAQRTEPAEIVVVDGGSSDRTVAIARAMGARVIESGPIGLARQRREGYLSSDFTYTAFVDADDRLPESWLGTMVTEMEAGGYHALQSRLRVLRPDSFWTRGWDEYFREAIRTQADTRMVGRPALYDTQALKTITREPGMIVEDTEMSRDFELRGLRQGIGSAVSYRLCPATTSENLQKWRNYGRGYRQFVRLHPERRISILKHMLWTIPVTRGFRPVLRGAFQQPAFGAATSLSALAGYLSDPE